MKEKKVIKKYNGALKAYFVTLFNFFLSSSLVIIYIFWGCLFSAVGAIWTALSKASIFSCSTGFSENFLTEKRDSANSRKLRELFVVQER